ncbi:hypothetical protein [Pseudolactococcus reticulitermitis]|uniref:Uncharacterized protein n=1 Tax=Pseudolactococcus reticulitermitis TaxID=2025039 RepID=A0A224X0L2_9LACT|nr:hypothetical protein [Lactococcus reticulitermitis]GAX46496.1 hypothetical protein RsY01_75 [Lactococcus reticulitermitis]
MESELTVSGQLGMVDPVTPPDLPKTSAPRYTVQQKSVAAPTGLLPSTGELQAAGGLMLIGLVCLILVLMIRRTQPKSKLSA